MNAAMTFSMRQFRRLQEVFRVRTHRKIDARSRDVTHENPTGVDASPLIQRYRRALVTYRGCCT
jgi:hypothetical protein